MFKRLVSLACTTMVVGSFLVLSTASAARADGDIRVSEPGVPTKVSISSGSCRDIPISMDFANDWYRVVDFDADVEIWRGSRHVENAWLRYHSNDRGVYSGKARGGYYWCSFDGFGTFRAGPTTGEWCNWDYDCQDWRSKKKSTFHVKQASRMVAMKYGRTGKALTFSGRAQYFKAIDYTDAWVGRSKGSKVVLQRRSATKKGAWTNVKTVRAKRGGAFTVSVTPKKRYQYRVAVVSGKTVWAGYSKPRVRG